LKLLKGICGRKRSFGNNEKKMPAEKFEMWKRKANKPKPKPIKIDDFDEDLMVNTISKQIDNSIRKHPL
jgi:hypothetical protein